MRENNRNPIEKCRKKLPQFTTMNVIDGQAGLVIYSSLIFYSLTIDNILNIIVLLILAGVTIAALSGDNGILQRATEAKEQTQIQSEEELRRLTQMEATMNLENTTHTDNSTGKEVTVTIPAGFAVSRVEGENTIAGGLVVIDKNGNEFVWVPVENFEEFEREHFGTEEQKWWSGTFVSDGLSANNLYEPTSDGFKDSTEVEKMYKSVKDNKGFYVGRYEAGTTASSGTGIRGEVVSKKGANAYNYIGFADTDDMTDETGGAVEIARGMYNKEEGDSVTSTLIYGVQWDAIMRWMQDIPNQTGEKYVRDSIGMGWYSDNYASGNATHQTGIDLDGGKNKVKNIYDLAGNITEWTMETYYISLRVTRGGSYGSLSYQSPSSYRYSSNVFPSLCDESFGFRVTLFL